MKIVHIIKSDSIGGASVAAMRLVKAQRAIGLESEMLVQQTQTDKPFVHSTTHSEFKKKINYYRLGLEKLQFLRNEVSPELRFAFSTANTGENIHRHPLVLNTDIIHLHWFNQGFLSLASLRKIARLGKPIVWTLHDMWAFTGGCHYVGACNKFMDECLDCQYINGNKENDKSTTIFRRKKRMYNSGNWYFIAPSKWMKNQADQSVLITQFKVENLPNAIDLDKFKPADKKEIRQKLNLPTDKKLILFGAMNIAEKRKGLHYFMEALYLLKERQIKNDVALVIFGKSNSSLLKQLPFTTYDLGLIEREEELTEIYQAADLFVIPSLEDNLPNTIVEAHASALPVIGFDNAGISEMIHHEEDGYLATYKSADDLAVGIYWILFEANLKKLSKNARIAAEINYEAKDVARKHKEFYEKILNDQF